MSLKNYQAHMELVAAAQESRARVVADARRVEAAGRARRALDRRARVANRARGVVAVLVAVLVVGVVL